MCQREWCMFFNLNSVHTPVNSSWGLSASWTALTGQNSKRQRDRLSVFSHKTGPADFISVLLRRPGEHGRTRSAEVSISNQICSIFTLCCIHYPKANSFVLLYTQPARRHEVRLEVVGRLGEQKEPLRCSEGTLSWRAVMLIKTLFRGRFAVWEIINIWLVIRPECCLKLSFLTSDDLRGTN